MPVGSKTRRGELGYCFGFIGDRSINWVPNSRER